MKDKTPEQVQNNKAYFAIISVLIASITFFIYLPALENGFVGWDDNTYILENVAIKSEDFSLFRWVFTPEFYTDWHPLTLLSHALAYKVWELNPSGHHLVNIIIHSLNTFLVFHLTMALTKHASRELEKGNMITAIIASILFGIHPINVEPVSWISGRKELLCTFFFMLSLITYLKYSLFSNKKFIFYCLSLFTFVLSVMSKPMAVTLPAVLLIIDFYPLRRLHAKYWAGSITKLLIEKWPFFLLSVIASLLTLDAYQSAGTVRSLEAVSFIKRIFITTDAYIFYLSKIFFPIDLAPFYPAADSIDFISFAIELFMVVAITLGSIKLSKNRPVFLATWLFFLVTLTPVIGIVQSGIPAKADRYIYLPGVGIFLLTGGYISYILMENKKKALLFLNSLALLFFVALLINKTVRQISIWHDSITLWSYEIRIFPESVALPYNNRGNAYNNSGDYRKALIDLDRAISIDPAYILAYNNRGNTYFFLGNYNMAIKDYSKAVVLDKKFSDAYYNRANSYSRLENYQSAINDLSVAIALSPDFADAYNNRGIAYSHLGHYSQAINDYQKAVKLNSRYGAAYLNLGLAYSHLGDAGRADNYFKKAVDMGIEKAQIYLHK